jgi:thioredoxin 1
MNRNGPTMVTKIKFNKSLINSKKLSIVNFIIDWNGASQIVTMIFESLAESYNGPVDFYTVNFEEEMAVSRELGVIEAPTILFFRNGELIDHTVGLVSKNSLIAKIETALSNNTSK